MLVRFLACSVSALLLLHLAGCTPSGTAASETFSPAESAVASSPAPALTPAAAQTGVAILYDSDADVAVSQAAAQLQDVLGGDLLALPEAADANFSRYEYILLGFSAPGNALPAAVADFLTGADLGARTILPFVADADDGDAVLAALSDAEPGALLGEALLLPAGDTLPAAVAAWADSLALDEEETAVTDTVLHAAVTPDVQQSFYLWEEGNAPAETEYTANNGQYFDEVR